MSATPRPQLTWTMCSRQPVSPAISMAWRIASSLGFDRTARRDNRARWFAARFSLREARSISPIPREPRRADPAPRRASFLRARVARSTRREVIDPAVAHESLQTDDAAIAQRFELLQIVRDQSAPQTEIDERVSSPRRRVSDRKLGPSIVGGWALSGMSKTVVVPPAAAAREPVANPPNPRVRVR